MKETMVPIDKAGRVVIPKGIREELALKPGDMLRISVQSQSVTLSPKRVASGFIKKGGVLVFSCRESQILTPEMVEELLIEDRQGRESYYTAGISKRK